MGSAVVSLRPGFFLENGTLDSGRAACSVEAVSREGIDSSCSQVVVVCTGHGAEGPEAAVAVAHRLLSRLEGGASAGPLDAAAVEAAFAAAHLELTRPDSGIDAASSGASALFVAVCAAAGPGAAPHLLVATAGTCHAVRARAGADGVLVASQLDADVTLDAPQERCRLESSAPGVQVEALEGPGPAAWRLSIDGREPVPGVAAARMLGCTAAAPLGVVPRPLVTVWPVAAGDRFAIAGSPGLWAAMPRQDAVDFVAAYVALGLGAQYDLCAADALTLEAQARLRAAAALRGGDEVPDVCAVVLPLSDDFAAAAAGDASAACGGGAVAPCGARSAAEASQLVAAWARDPGSGPGAVPAGPPFPELHTRLLSHPWQALQRSAGLFGSGAAVPWAAAPVPSRHVGNPRRCSSGSAASGSPHCGGFVLTKRHSMELEFAKGAPYIGGAGGGADSGDAEDTPCSSLSEASQHVVLHKVYLDGPDEMESLLYGSATSAQPNTTVARHLPSMRRSHSTGTHLAFAQTVPTSAFAANNAAPPLPTAPMRVGKARSYQALAALDKARSFQAPPHASWGDALGQLPSLSDPLHGWPNGWPIQRPPRPGALSGLTRSAPGGGKGLEGRQHGSTDSFHAFEALARASPSSAPGNSGGLPVAPSSATSAASSEGGLTPADSTSLPGAAALSCAQPRAQEAGGGDATCQGAAVPGVLEADAKAAACDALAALQAAGVAEDDATAAAQQQGAWQRANPLSMLKEAFSGGGRSGARTRSQPSSPLASPRRPPQEGASPHATPAASEGWGAAGLAGDHTGEGWRAGGSSRIAGVAEALTEQLQGGGNAPEHAVHGGQRKGLYRPKSSPDLQQAAADVLRSEAPRRQQWGSPAILDDPFALAAAAAPPFSRRDSGGSGSAPESGGGSTHASGALPPPEAATLSPAPALEATQRPRRKARLPPSASLPSLDQGLYPRPIGRTLSLSHSEMPRWRHGWLSNDSADDLLTAEESEGRLHGGRSSRHTTSGASLSAVASYSSLQSGGSLSANGATSMLTASAPAYVSTATSSFHAAPPSRPRSSWVNAFVTGGDAAVAAVGMAAPASVWGAASSSPMLRSGSGLTSAYGSSSEEGAHLDSSGGSGGVSSVAAAAAAANAPPSPRVVRVSMDGPGLMPAEASLAGAGSARSRAEPPPLLMQLQTGRSSHLCPLPVLREADAEPGGGSPSTGGSVGNGPRSLASSSLADLASCMADAGDECPRCPSALDNAAAAPASARRPSDGHAFEFCPPQHSVLLSSSPALVTTLRPLALQPPSRLRAAGSAVAAPVAAARSSAVVAAAPRVRDAGSPSAPGALSRGSSLGASATPDGSSTPMSSPPVTPCRLADSEGRATGGAMMGALGRAAASPAASSDLRVSSSSGSPETTRGMSTSTVASTATLSAWDHHGA